MVEVVTFAGTLTDAREHGQAAVLLGDVVDELQHVHGLADTSATEQANFAALGEGCEQVDDLDAGDEQILAASLFIVRGRRTVDRPLFLGGHGTTVILRRTEHVHDATERRRTHWHRDRRTSRFDREAALQAFRCAHRDGSHNAITELLLHFQRQIDVGELQRLVDLRDRVAGKLHVDDRADDLRNLARCHVGTLCLESLNA